MIASFEKFQRVQVNRILTEEYKERIDIGEVPNGNIKHFADSPPFRPDEVHLAKLHEFGNCMERRQYTSPRLRKE